jgi:hypothetical protein
MDIAVIGTGNLGTALGTRWAQCGHRVIFGSRHPDSEELDALAERAGPDARVAGRGEAAQAADIVVVATPWRATKDTVKVMGRLDGKIVVDCTNPLSADGDRLVLDRSTSAAERIASWVGEARIVKAFNTTGTENIENPEYGDQRLSMFLCGDDADAKATVAELAETLGFEAVDCGPLHQAAHLESMAMLWIQLAYGEGYGSDIGFALLQRNGASG